jgi:hypothetical protein
VSPTGQENREGLSRLRLIAQFLLAWESLTCMALVGTAIVFMVWPQAYGLIPGYLTNPCPDQQSRLDFMLSSITQGGAVLFALVASVLTWASTSTARYRFPLSYWTLGFRGWARVFLMAVSVFLPLVLLLIDGYVLSPWALAFFVLALVVLFFLAVDQVRNTTLDTFAMVAFKKLKKRKKPVGLPPHWIPHLQDMASRALHSFDEEDLSKILVVLGNILPNGGTPGSSIHYYVAALGREITDQCDDSQLSIFLHSVCGFAAPLASPPFMQLRDKQQRELDKSLKGGDMNTLIEAALNPCYRLGLDRPSKDYFWGIVLLLLQVHEQSTATKWRRAQYVRNALCTILLDYYVWDMVTSTNTISSIWDLTLVSFAKDVKLDFSDENLVKSVYSSCLMHIDIYLDKTGDREGMRSELSNLKGLALNRLIADLYTSAYDLSCGKKVNCWHYGVRTRGVVKGDICVFH